MPAFQLRLPALLVLSALAGCSSTTAIRAIDERSQIASSTIEQSKAAFTAKLTEAKRLEEQEVNRPFLTGTPQPLAREVTLPAALRADVDTAMMFPGGRVDLLALAERITLATGIHVEVTPDALLPMDQFLPKLATNTGGGAGPVPIPSPQIAIPSGRISLPNLLDAAASRMGVFWEYEHGRIKIYRTQTRTYNVRALAMTSTATAALGKTGTSSASTGQGNGSFQATSNTSISLVGGDILASIKSKLEPFLTRSGVIAATTESSNYIVVTDKRDVLDRIGQFIEKENKALTRRVRFIFEQVEIEAKDSNSQGIDWNAVYTYGSGMKAVGMASPTTLAETTAGSISLAAKGGPFAGSSIILRGLNEVARVVRRTQIPMLALNRRPVTHAVRTTFSYVDQVQVTTVASMAGTSTAPSVTQKDETVGTFLTLLPDAQDDGQILLSLSYDSTVAQPLKTLTFGSSGNQVQLQQKTIDGMGMVQQIELKPGQPVIITGFEKNEEQYDRRRLDDAAPLIAGGSNKTAQSNRQVIMILTAQVEEGV